MPRNAIWCGDHIEILRTRFNNPMAPKFQVFIVDPPHLNAGSLFHTPFPTENPLYPSPQEELFKAQLDLYHAQTLKYYKEIMNQEDSLSFHLRSLEKSINRDNTRVADCIWKITSFREFHKHTLETGGIIVLAHSNNHADFRTLLDEIYGRDNFKAEYKWRRMPGRHNDGKKRSSVMCDYALIYAKNAKLCPWNPTKEPMSKETFDSYTCKDEKGSYKWISVRAGSLNGPETSWNGGEKIKFKHGEKLLRQESEEGSLKYDDKGVPTHRKCYRPDDGLMLSGDLWLDVCSSPPENERIYTTQESKEHPHPAQKAEEVYRRLIRCVANEGDLACDPTSGSGTLARVAEELKMPWVTMEIDPREVDIEKESLRKKFGDHVIDPDYTEDRCCPYNVMVAEHLSTIVTLPAKHDCEDYWIIQVLQGVVNANRYEKDYDGIRSAVDARLGAFSIPVQVKTTQQDRSDVRALHSAMKRLGSPMGILAVNKKSAAVQDEIRLLDEELGPFQNFLLDGSGSVERSRIFYVDLEDVAKNNGTLYQHLPTATAERKEFVVSNAKPTKLKMNPDEPDLFELGIKESE